MDFAVMGTLSSYVKQKNLTFAAKHKIRTGQTLTNSNGNLLSANLISTFDKMRKAAKSSTDQGKQLKLRRIKQKLHAGQKLSDEELGFLRVNDPKTYKKAKSADEAREELKSELKKARSKSEAREAMTRAMVKASASAMAELSALGQGGGSSQGAGGAVQAGGDAVNFGGEVSSAAGTGGAEGQNFIDANQSIQASGERAAGEVSESTRESTSAHDDKNSTNADKISDTQKNSDADNLTPEDIMEKYIWTIRALEDEWAHFTNSDEYKNLPNQTIDNGIVKKNLRRTIDTPNRRFFNAAAAYRKSMTYSLGVA